MRTAVEAPTRRFIVLASVLALTLAMVRHPTESERVPVESSRVVSERDLQARIAAAQANVEVGQDDATRAAALQELTQLDRDLDMYMHRSDIDQARR